MEPEQQATQPASARGGGGKSKLILIIVGVLIVVFGGIFAYGKFVKKADTLGEILTPTKLNSTCKYNDPDLCKFINNWKEVKNMTMTSLSTDKDGKKSEWILKTEGDTKSQMISSEGGKENGNFISIAETSYNKDYTDNKWFKYTAAKSESSILDSEESKIDFDDKADAVEDKTTYKKIGTESCGKFTCFKYQVIDPANTESTEYIYFDNKEYQLRKTRSEAKDGSVSESTFDYSKVSISEPSPVKEGNPYSVSAPATGNMSEAELNAEIERMNAAAAAQSASAPAAESYTAPEDTSVDTGAADDSTGE